jgi:hypothetical protein
LGRHDVRVSQHLRYGFDRHSFGQRHRRRERVPRKVESDRLCKEKRTGKDKT